MKFRLFRLRRVAGLGRARLRGRVLARRILFRLRLPLWLLMLLLPLFTVLFRSYLPQPVVSGLEQVGAAVQEGVDRALPVLARPFQPDSDRAYQLVAESLPRSAGTQESSFAAVLSAARSWLHRLIGYDPAYPVSLFEAELVGYASFARGVPESPDHSGVPEPERAPAIPAPPQQVDPVLPVPTLPDVENIPEPEQPERMPEPITPIEPIDPLDPEGLLRTALWGDEPLIAILHTHPSEMYRTDTFAPMSSSGYHLFDTTDTGIIRVGRRLADTLREQYGIPVIHNTNLHDTPCHSCAYVESRKTVEMLLRQYPSIKVIVDVHRDGAEDLSMVTSVGEAEAAQIALVVGRPANESRHPRWQENDAFARRLSEIMYSRYPGLFRRTIYLNGVYNQDLHPRAILVEVGNYYDHEEYAVHSAELLAAVLAEALHEVLYGPLPVNGEAESPLFSLN